jgi:RHS repeat-associated protein
VLDANRQVLAFNIFTPGCASPLLTIAAGEPLFLLCDPLGGTSIVTDAGGIVMGRVDVDAFGYPSALPAKPANLFLLHGMEYDRALELYHAGLRWYDPRIGRFLTPDSLIGKLTDVQLQNAYSFARNAPTANADPSGAQSIGLDLSGSLTAAQNAAVTASKLTASEFLILKDNLASNILAQNNAAGNALQQTPATARAAAAAILEDLLRKTNLKGNKLWNDLNAQPRFKPAPGPIGATSLPAPAPGGAAAAGQAVAPGLNSANADVPTLNSRPPPALPRPPVPAPGAGAAAVAGESTVAAAAGEASLSVNSIPGQTSIDSLIARPPQGPPMVTAPGSGAAAAGEASLSVNSIPGQRSIDSLIARPPQGPPTVTAPGTAAAAGEASLSVNTIPGQNTIDSLMGRPPAGPPTVTAGGTPPPQTGPAAARPAPATTSPANEPTSPNYADLAKVLGATAIINGLTDAANCGARGGDATQCLQAFGSGTLNGAVGGVVGATVVAGGTAIAKAALGASGLSANAVAAISAAGTFVGGGAAIVGTAIMGGRLGAAIGNLANAQIYGTPQQQAAAARTLAAIDQRIAELNALNQRGAQTLAGPLATARDLRTQLASFRGGPGRTPPRNATPADATDVEQLLTQACSAATTALFNLDGIVDDAGARAQNAATLLRNPAPLDDTPGPTIAGANAARAAFERIAEAARVAQLAATALNDVRTRMAQIPNAQASAEEWRNRIAAFNGALQQLEGAIRSAQALKGEFDALLLRARQEAEASIGTIVGTADAAFERRRSLMREMHFTNDLDTAVDILGAGPGEIAATARLVQQQTGEANVAGGQRNDACGAFGGQPPGWQTFSQNLRTGQLASIQAALRLVSDATRERNEAVARVERVNAQVLSEGPTRQQRATAAGDAQLARDIAAAIERSTQRASVSLVPQRQALNQLTASQTAANDATNRAVNQVRALP